MVQKCARPKLAWTPVWEGIVKQWSMKFIHKNKWRCDHTSDFEDLLQDAFLTFMKLCKKYPRVIEPANFMSLYKTAIANQMHDRSRYMRRKRESHMETSVDVSELYTGRIGEVSNEGYLNALISEAPDELRAALSIIATNPEALKNRRGYQRENLNMKLRRLLGLDQCQLDEHRSYDITGKLRELLTGEV